MTATRVCDLDPFQSPVVAQVVNLQTAGSAVEILTQTLENYLARLKTAICEDFTQIVEECCGAQGAQTFLELDDTPDSYEDQQGKVVTVNSLETGLNFFPTTFTGKAGQLMAVKGAEDGFEFFPTTFSGQANKMVVVKNAEDGFELQDQPVLPTYFLTPRLTLAWPPHAGAGQFGTLGVAVTGANVAIPTSPADALAASLRFSLTAAAALNSNALIRSPVFQLTRGSAAPMGGFRLRWRFGLTQYAAGARCFIGLWNSIAAQPFSTADPSALTNVFFLGFDDTDSTWQIMHNDNTLTCTKVDTTETIAINILYELVISASPSASSIEWELHNLEDGTSFGGSVNTNLPQDTIPLTPAMQIGSAASGAQNRLDHVSMFLETGPEP